MNKFFSFLTRNLTLSFGLIMAVILALYAVNALAIPYPNLLEGNTLVKGKIHVTEPYGGTITGIETMRIGLGNADTEMRIDAPGSPLVCVGLAGVQETGAATGYVTVGDAADYLRFAVQLPEAWLDLGKVADLEFEFYISEQGSAECNIDVRIFEFNNTTPIIIDTIAIANGATAGWVNLVTLSTGIGADADIDPGDTLVFEITATTNDDDFNIYGVRIKYSMGLETTGDGLDFN